MPGLHPYSFSNDIMGFFMTTESQDLGLTSHPKDGSFTEQSPHHYTGALGPTQATGLAFPACLINCSVSKLFLEFYHNTIVPIMDGSFTEQSPHHYTGALGPTQATGLAFPACLINCSVSKLFLEFYHNTIVPIMPPPPPQQKQQPFVPVTSSYVSINFQI